MSVNNSSFGRIFTVSDITAWQKLLISHHPTVIYRLSLR